MKTAQLGGVPIPLLANLGTRQRYASAVRETIYPMGDGSLIKKILAGSATRLVTTLRGTGPVPPGLSGLDYTGTLLLRCAAERDIVSASNVIAIPSARRSDTGYTPWGRAFVDLDVVATSVVIAGDTATLGLVAGADAYQVLWFPEITVYVENGLETTANVSEATVDWQLKMREI